MRFKEFLDGYLKIKDSRLNEDQGVTRTVKVNFNVNFDTEIYDDAMLHYL